MKTQIITLAMASSLLITAANPAYANEPNTGSDSNRQYIGTGIGAVAGALVAGPVGFITGGLIGNLAGRHDATSRKSPEQPVAEEIMQVPAPALAAPETEVSAASAESVIVAQAGDIDSIIDESNVDASSKLKDILINEMEIDVLFISGSTTVEDYYQQRIRMISSLLQQMPGIHVYLDGYSDRRGDSDTNLELANQRLDSVRKQLVQTGIDNSRIHINAFGEQQFVSSPGDLEAYTFDRRVVVRFGYEAEETEDPVAMITSQPSQ